MSKAESSPRLFGAAEVCLGRQRSPQHESGPHMLPYLRAANVKDGRLDLSDVKTMNFSPSEQKTFALQAGDILVTEGSGSLGAVGASAVWHDELPGTICFQNTLVRLRPRAGISDGRYLGWWARSAFASGQFASIASGANIYHVSAERVKGLPAPLPPLDEQRRIADFLDAETARIDHVLCDRRSQAALLDARESSLLDRAYSSNPFEEIRLKHLVARITSGPRGWGELISDEGTPFFRIMNIPRRGVRLELTDLAHVTAPHGRERERTRTRIGDVLVSITADIGSVAVVDDLAINGNVSQHIALVRPELSLCDPAWLAYAIKSPAARGQLVGNSYGGTKIGLGLGDIAELRLPRLELPAQQIMARRIDRAMLGSKIVREEIMDQIVLLAERRQALITAAVTGQLDVTTARPALPSVGGVSA
ncbi:type I restriction enzyme S subunit [Streptomyces sp. 846.5]|nr:restriction endonuclease subunit S [Streptomyces sp. 846.5]TDU04184.1 type I restriction enzyme S subunit [Streptomyces sp. 846.5]